MLHSHVCFIHTGYNIEGHSFSFLNFFFKLRVSHISREPEIWLKIALISNSPASPP